MHLEAALRGRPAQVAVERQTGAGALVERALVEPQLMTAVAAPGGQRAVGGSLQRGGVVAVAGPA